MAKNKFLIGLLLMTALAGLAIWLSLSEKVVPAIKGGVLDLRGWDPETNGILTLDGEWEFYPNQLLTPQQSRNPSGDPSGKPFGAQTAEGRLIQVPGGWDGWRDRDGTAMKGFGYATYRLLIRNAPADRMLAVSKNYVRFADRLYIDGVLMGESGMPGVSREDYKPRNVPYTVFFKPGGSEIEILLQVANFDYKTGGISSSLQFGLGKEMQIKKSVQTGLDLMGTVIILLFAALYTGFYIWFHRNTLLLLFGAYFFLYGISIITNGERLFLQLFPFISFELAFKIKTISVFLAPALLLFISWKLIGNAAIRKVLFSSAVALSIYCAGVAVLPFRLYSLAQDAFYLGLTLNYALLFIFLLISYIRRSYGALDKRQFQLFFAAVWSHLLIGLIVILNSENIVSMFVANIIFFLFVIFVALLFILQYVRAYSAMKRLTKQLQKADRMKDEFLLITSHELNTPLHGIINLSQSLLKLPNRKFAENDAKEKLQLIRNTAYRMSNMVKDIIDTARIKEGRLQVETGKVDLVTCVSVLIEVFGFLAKGKNTMLDHRIEPGARYVIADENRLMQVLYNAINHSLRDVRDGVVSIGSGLRDGGVVIRIGHRGAIARTGGDVSEQAEEDNGFAVGLSIAYELVELMGGKFEMDGSGGAMEVLLPAAVEDSMREIAAAAEREVKPQWHGVKSEGRTAVVGAEKILIASADPVNVEHLYGMLSTEGFEVACADSDTNAYSLITQIDRPDLAILDVMLPDSNGYELCRSIRRHFTQAELPILFISARSTPADIEAGIAAGGSDFIARPLDAGEIRVRINTLLSMKRLVKEAAVNEMAFLRSQIKPHFLYNTLGTIMSLCYTDGARAGELLGIFSRYLRIIFHMDNTDETVNLSKEMELIQAYADIEKERFGERVRVVFDVDEQLYGCKVMPLTIEPLVENAIRHGVSKKMSGGTVRLTIRKQDEFVQVIVEDDGAGMSPEQVKSILERDKREQGVGFRNIMRRVAHLTGRQPIVESERGKGTKVTIWLPLTYS